MASARDPTVVNAHDSVSDGVLVNHAGKPTDGHYTYAVKENGELVIGERNGKDGKTTPHPTLSAAGSHKSKLLEWLQGRTVKLSSMTIKAGASRQTTFRCLRLAFTKSFLVLTGCRGCVSYGAASMSLWHLRKRKTKKRYSRISRLYRFVGMANSLCCTA